MCVVVCAAILRNVGAEYTDMMVGFFPGIETEELHRVIDKRDLGSQKTIIINVSTNNMRTKRNLDCVMGEVYALVATAKRKLPKCRLFLSGLLRRRDVSWKRTGALNGRYDWVANAFELTLIRAAG